MFKYEDSVAKHWPEFGQNGKENVKICDVFRHQSGLSWFTGKSFLEALILASVNPQYDNRLFIELQVQYEKNTCCVQKIVLNVKTRTKNNFCAQHVLNLYFSCTELVIQ